jgi:pilus assembly protein CpaB
LTRRTLIIALAGLLALLGVVGVFAYARNANNRAVAGLKAETVLAAKGPITAGTSLETAQQHDQLTSEKVPVDSLSTDPVRSVTGDDADLVVSANVASGQVLLQNMLTSSSTLAAGQSNPSLQVPAGMVAITVQLCASEAVANYLTAGSKVIVYATIPYSSSSGISQQCGVSHGGVPPAAAYTAQVMANTTVLSVTAAQPSSSSTSTGSGNSSAVTDPVTTQLSGGAVAVTLAVDPGTQAEALIQAAQLYLLYLALEPTGAN